MQLNRIAMLAALCLLAALPAVAQAINADDTGTASAVNISPRQHGPIHHHQMHDDGTSTSSNWSGYAVTGSSFTSAKASWVVPTVNCTTTPNTYAAFWVGLDGYSSSTVEQTGTDSDCDGKTASYYAWYEFYPAASILISSLPVSPGNIMGAQVSYSGSTFTVTITNESTGKTYSKTGTVRGAARSSAEWIAEAPCCTNSGGILPLSDFGTVGFGSDHTNVSGTNDATETSTSGPISAFGSNIDEITMTSSKGANEAVPSSLSSDGTSFTVAWKSE